MRSIYDNWRIRLSQHLLLINNSRLYHYCSVQSGYIVLKSVVMVVGNFSARRQPP